MMFFCVFFQNEMLLIWIKQQQVLLGQAKFHLPMLGRNKV